MPLPIQLAGQPITAAEAQKYIEKQLSLKKCLKDEVLVNIAPVLKADAIVSDTNTYFNSDANAFIFSKETIMRFFEPADPKAPKADYLMVIMGAKYLDNGEKGNPTVVVAGVNEDPLKKNSYLSLDIDDPGTEQPPRQSITTFPIHDAATGFTKIQFTII